MSEQPIEATPRIRERILGVYNLMQGATTPGEFDAAKHQLDAMLTKYGLTMDDFINPEQPTDWVWFKYRNHDELRLLSQVVFMVTEKNIDSSKLQVYAHCKEVCHMLTKEQGIDVTLLYNALVKDYRKAIARQKKIWAQQKKTFLNAFVNANDLFPDTTDDAEREKPELTPERLAYLKALMDMMNGINPTEDPRKAGYLGDGK